MKIKTLHASPTLRPVPKSSIRLPVKHYTLSDKKELWPSAFSGNRVTYITINKLEYELRFRSVFELGRKNNAKRRPPCRHNLKARLK